MNNERLRARHSLVETNLKGLRATLLSLLRLFLLVPKKFALQYFSGFPFYPLCSIYGRIKSNSVLLSFLCKALEASHRAKRNRCGCPARNFCEAKHRLHTVQLHLRYSATSFAAGTVGSRLCLPLSRLWRQLPSSRGAEKRSN